MGFCEKCGKLIEEGEVFCSDCASGLKKESVEKSDLGVSKTDIDHEIFTFKRKHKSKWISLMNFFPLLFAVLAILIGLTAIFSDDINLDVSSFILPIGVAIVGLFITFLLAKKSEQDKVIFLALYIPILTLSGALIYPEEADIIIQIGVVLFSLILVLKIIRRPTRNYALILGIITIIICLGGALILSEMSEIILGVGLAFTGVLIIISKFF